MRLQAIDSEELTGLTSGGMGGIWMGGKAKITGGAPVMEWSALGGSQQASPIPHPVLAHRAWSASVLISVALGKTMSKVPYEVD